MSSQAITTARRVTKVSPEMAEQVEGYLKWLRSRPDEQCTDFMEAQVSLRQPHILAWTPEQKYLLFLYFASGQTMAEAAQQFSNLGFRSWQSAYDMLKCLKLLTNYSPPIQYFRMHTTRDDAQFHRQINHEPVTPNCPTFPAPIVIKQEQHEVCEDSKAALAQPNSGNSTQLVDASHLRIKQESNITRNGMNIFG